MSRRDSGSVLIVALVAIAVLALIAATATSGIRADLLSQQNKVERRRAERAAQSGVQFALASLISVDANVLTQNDDWVQLNGQTRYVIGDSSYRVQVLDLGSRVNINTTTEAQLEEMPLTTEQIESLLDWREAELQPRVEGAKDEYYNNLTDPYNARLRRFDTLTELLLVKGWLPSTLYEPVEDTTNDPLVNGSQEDQPRLAELLTADSMSPNTNESGEQRLNVNQVQAQQMTQRGISQTIAQAIVQRRNTQGTFETMRQVLEVQGMTLENAEAVLNNLSVSAEASVEGKINLNTATEAVLNTIPDMTSDTVNAILGQQGSFASLGELATLSGVTLEVVQQTADYFTVGSSMFLVRTMGEQAGRRVFLEAIVEIVEGTPKIKRIEATPFGEMRERWGWETDPGQETIIVESQS